MDRFRTSVRELNNSSIRKNPEFTCDFWAVKVQRKKSCGLLVMIYNVVTCNHDVSHI